jgi:ABC-type Fe3+/spermidine/putrescine transport system ATPase subunit
LECTIPEGLKPDSPVTVAIRPEEIRITENYAPDQNINNVRVIESEFLGSFSRLICQLNDENQTQLLVEVSNNLMEELELKVDSTLFIHLPSEIIRVYPGNLNNRS